MKKNTLFLAALLFVSTITFSQTYVMGTDTGTITTCSGTFVDSGGASGTYSSNEDTTITFCPTTAGDLIQIDFSSFNTQGAAGACNDILEAWPGPDNTSTSYGQFCANLGAFTITSTSADGCITLQFTSDAALTQAGWEAAITCITPCTAPIAALTDDSEVDLCSTDALNPGDLTLNFDASASTSPGAGTTLTTYDWSWGDGTSETTTTPTVSHTFPGTGGIYMVNLSVRNDNTDTDPLGCQSTNAVTKQINIFTAPSYASTGGIETGSGNTAATTITIDCGDTVDLNGLVTSQTTTQPIPELDAGITQLPDGSGASYESSLDFTGLFPIGETITPGCYPTLNFTIEHSYTGDLDIFLIAPSGEIVQVFDQTGGGTHFGTCANQPDDGVPGCVALYSVVNSGAIDWTAAGVTTTATSNCATYTGTCESGNYFIAQTYNSNQSFAAFDGADLNGIWSLRITDNLAIDDGVLESWSLDFDTGCYVDLESVTPNLDMNTTSGVWQHTGTGPALPSQSPTSIAVTNPGPGDCPAGQTCEGNEITNNVVVGPFETGGETHVYSFLVTDEFGCEYQQDVTINVADNCTQCSLDLYSAAGTDAQTLCENTPITDITYIAGNEVVDVTVTGLPTGVTGAYDAANSLFTITGTPTVTGVYTYSVSTVGCLNTVIVTLTGTITITEIPTAAISYAGTPFCTATTTEEAVTITGTAAYTGGTYSSTAGLTLDATTGAITPSSSTAGTYTVTYSIPASGGCPAEDVTTTVDITEAPTATISYAGTPFCMSITTEEAVSITGTAAYTGGTYSSTAGLTLNTTTGAIVPSTSTAGTYTVTYSIPASSGCPAEDVTTTVDITEIPTATISYAGTPFCTATTTEEAVTITGAAAYTGGTYSSTAGLTLDATTGAITPSSSTAGTYTVTYSIPASGGCPAEDVTTTVDITEAPTATISYAGTPFCMSITTEEAVSITGTAAYTGGTYSSTAGLTLNTTTGAIVPSTSTAGTYTVTYSIPASSGCPAEDVTTTVDITEIPTATISYAGTPFCTATTTEEAVTITGAAAYTGGTYSSTAGLTLDATTGAITPSSSTAGTYTVTYSIPASGGCPAEDVTTTVDITEAPTATISYAGTPFCMSITTEEAVSITGTAAYTGGTYSSTAGLTLNTTTGAIVPSTSTAGTYTVTYSIPASSGCPAEDVTTTVDITEIPTATISYAGTPFCTATTTEEAVTITGTAAYTGGTYSSTAGLTLDATTGAITPSSSTAGTYTVTYSIPASGGCPAEDVTTTVDITEAPTATISYAGTPFCMSITTEEAVSITGTAAYTGGTYSSTAGLTLNTTTGAIVPSTSTAGTYTVTYSIPASSGCPAEDVTTTVDITEIPTATISYAGTPFCTATTTEEAVTITGAAAYTGGTYSSTAGLTLDATTGAITPSSSTAGTYTVTYSIPASGGCPAEDVTTTVDITEAPTATISYAGTPFCMSITTEEAVSITGTAAYTGGTYSSTAGLTLNTTTGAIVPSTSTAGTYTVTYSIPASSGCPAEDVTTTVDITEIPTATISYAGTPFCTATTTEEAVTITGTAAYTGGTYSSTAGLTLDVATGAITPSTSTAGTYTITYSIPASVGCPAEDVTTTVEITSASTASISYDSSPYCISETALVGVTLTGTGSYTGGTYSSTAGLTIDATTGAITANTSTAGTYTVTYTVPAMGGCAAAPVTTSVVITEVPTAVINYAGAPFCTDSGVIEAVTLTGTAAYTGGVYSSIAGLIIDTATGDINLGASVAGTYTITYTIPASAGCESEVATTTININNAPTATISYIGAPFCITDTTASIVTLTGTDAYTGGTYSATAGLTIDVATGEITPSTSTAGSHTVTYTIPASAGCMAVPVTTIVDITEVPTAAIMYDGAPFCISITGDEAVTLTGTDAYTGGTYSSTVGLTLDATTGAITPSTSIVGAYVVTYTTPSTGGCTAITTTTTITVNNAPSANVVTPLNTCDADNDGFGLFDINNPTTLAEITGGSPLYVVTYHETLAEANAGVGAIDTTVLYPNINVYTQTVYVRVSLSATGCYTIVDLVLNVIDSPSLPSEALEYALCDDFNDLTDGLASFDLATYNAVVLANIAAGTTPSDYTVSYYTALDASGSPDPASLIANPSAFQNTSTPDQTIYVSVVRNDVYSCESIKEINLHVDLLPDALYQSIDVCDDAVADGFYEFNLTDYTDLISGGTTDVTLSFYTIEADAIAGAGASLIANPLAFTNTSNPQSIFVRVYRASTGCFAVTPFTLHVDPNPTPLNTADIASNLGVLMACDGNVDGAGDIAEQVAEFDLTTWESQILTGTGPGVEVGVSASYYTDAAEAATATNPIATPTTFSNTSNPQTIYVRVTNDGTGITPATSGTGCYQVVSFQIYVPMPWVTVSGDTILCVDSSGVPLPSQPLPVITAVGGPDTSASYSYQWALNGSAIAGATSATLPAVLPGDYTVTVAGPTDLSCVNTATHTITVSGMPDDYTATISTNAFADFHQIVATATSSSAGIEFLFSLDGGAFQNTGVFNDVSPGLHAVTIKDTEGCWEDTLTVLVVDYPHFFTPNNDGYNDTWQVTGSSDVVILGIVIYDRQGKALHRLAPGESWDGRYNGTLMPSNDYWFVITYTEGVADPVQKEFRAHFALKL